MKKNHILLISFLMISTSLLSQHYNNLHYIPDDNLRTELYKMGFTNQDSLLDENKIKGRLQLELAKKGIKNLDGLQHFKQVWNLNISYNEIEELKNLPDNLKSLACSKNEIKELKNLPSTLEYLNCSHNKLQRIDNLPSNLKKLICSNNSIKKIINLPDSLIFLDFCNNSVTSFPVLPSSLQSINYYNNKLNINKLPELYKNNIACDHPNQNCLPYELVNWELLRNNIKDTIFEILEVKVTIKGEHSWGIGNDRRTINFIKKDNQLICENENLYSSAGIFNKEPINENIENNHSINIEELEQFLKDLYNRKMILEFQVNDSFETINLKTKRNGYPSCSYMCQDGSYYFNQYDIYTTKDTISLKYNSESCGNRTLCGKSWQSTDTFNPPEIIKDILEQLYIFKLEKLILNNDYDNRNAIDNIKTYLDWEKNYK